MEQFIPNTGLLGMYLRYSWKEAKNLGCQVEDAFGSSNRMLMKIQRLMRGGTFCIWGDYQGSAAVPGELGWAST